MNKDKGLWFRFGISDFTAVCESLIGLIFTLLYAPGNLFLYLLIVSLVLSLFMEKGAQIYIIITAFTYFLLNQIFLVNLAGLNIFDYFLLTGLSKNTTIVLINLFCLILVSGLSVISAILTTYNMRKNKRYDLEYASVVSIVLFIIFALILSIMLSQDLGPLTIDINQVQHALGVQDAYGVNFISDPTPGRVLGFYFTICQFFTFFSVLYFLILTIILFQPASS